MAKGFRHAERSNLENILVGACAAPDATCAPVLPVSLRIKRHAAEVVNKGRSSGAISKAVQTPLLLHAVFPNRDHRPRSAGKAVPPRSDGSVLRLRSVQISSDSAT